MEDPPGNLSFPPPRMNEDGSFLVRNALRTSGRKSRLIRKRATRRSRRRRFTARGVSRRLIKTESTLRPTETPCPTARTRSDGIFEGPPPLYTSASCPRNWFAPNNYFLPGKRALSRYGSSEQLQAHLRFAAMLRGDCHISDVTAGAWSVQVKS